MIVLYSETMLDNFLPAANVNFGHSVGGTMKQDTCDDFLICNRKLKATHPKRSLMDLAVRFKTKDQNIRSFEQHSAAYCWLEYLDRKSNDSLKIFHLLNDMYLLYFTLVLMAWCGKIKINSFQTTRDAIGLASHEMCQYQEL